MRRCAGYDEVIQLGLGKSGTTTIQKFFVDRYDYNATCGIGKTSEELQAWYDGVNAHIAFLFAHRHNYVRVDVDDLASLRALERVCGGYNRSYNWMPQNVNTRVPPRVSKRR